MADSGNETTESTGCPHCPSPNTCACPDSPAVCREGGACVCDPAVCPCPGHIPDGPPPKDPPTEPLPPPADTPDRGKEVVDADGDDEGGLGCLLSPLILALFGGGIILALIFWFVFSGDDDDSAPPDPDPESAVVEDDPTESEPLNPIEDDPAEETPIEDDPVEEEPVVVPLRAPATPATVAGSSVFAAGGFLSALAGDLEALDGYGQSLTTTGINVEVVEAGFFDGFGPKDLFDDLGGYTTIFSAPNPMVDQRHWLITQQLESADRDPDGTYQDVLLAGSSPLVIPHDDDHADAFSRLEPGSVSSIFAIDPAEGTVIRRLPNDEFREVDTYAFAAIGNGQIIWGIPENELDDYIFFQSFLRKILGDEAAESDPTLYSLFGPVPGRDVASADPGRFTIEATAVDTDGQVLQGTETQTGSESLFWFFDPANADLLVKVLDGCGEFNNFWMFAAPLTDVEVMLTVTDTQTETTRDLPLPNYTPVMDTSAFEGCAQ